PAWPYQDPAPPPAAAPARPRRPLPFPVSLHATEHNDGRPQESTEKQIESDPRAHGNNAQLRQRLPGSNYFTGSPAPRTLDLGERPPPIFPDTRRPHRGPTTTSRPRSGARDAWSIWSYARSRCG